VARNAGLGFVVSEQAFDAARPNRAFAWADASGDGRADLFVCDRSTGVAQVFHATTSLTLETLARPVATGFCRPGEQFRVGDVDDNGLADAVRFHMSATAPTGRVMVALNTGSGFSAPTVWHDFFGIGAEQVSVADLTGDGKADVVTCVPGAGAFVAQSSGTAFINSRRPRVGIGMATALPTLDDLAQPGQRCLTGNFDGGTRSDLVVFAQGAGGMIDDFHDSRGDVYVALSHTMLDFTDFYRVGRPRIRHDDFCRAGEQCAVGDVNNDGADDLISFARGADGTNRVNVALATFENARTWTLDLIRIRAQVTEGTADKPLVLALNFRSTVGRVGSTVITRNAYNETFAQGIVAGGPAIAIPTDVGRATFTGVRLRTVDDLMRGESLEIFGTVVLVMEKDLSAAAAYTGLLDEATRALAEVLNALVERRSVISLVTGGGLLGANLDSLRAQLQDNMMSALDDLLHLVVTGLFDPDDFINVHVALFPALDKETFGFIPAPTDPRASLGVPGEGLFGVAFGTMPFDDEDSPLRYDIDAMFR
jgi:hypothetical protein